MSRSMLAALALVFTLAGAAVGTEEAPNPQATPKAAAAEALRLLEAGEHRKLLENFVPPAILKEMKSDGQFEEILKSFKERKAAQLLSALKQIQDVDPKMNEAGDRATWKLPTPAGTHEDIQFEKHGDRWYIGN